MSGVDSELNIILPTYIPHDEIKEGSFLTPRLIAPNMFWTR